MPKKAPCGCYEFDDVFAVGNYAKWVDKIIYAVVNGYHFKVHRNGGNEFSACGREFTQEELNRFIQSPKSF